MRAPSGDSGQDVVFVDYSSTSASCGVYCSSSSPTSVSEMFKNAVLLIDQPVHEVSGAAEHANSNAAATGEDE